MSKRKAPLSVLAYYNGKVKSMDDVDPKIRFSIGCYCVRDNAGSGYVIEGEKVYSIAPQSRAAKPVSGDERERVLAEVSALPVQTRRVL